MAKKDKSLDEVTAAGAGLYGASAASAEAAASDELRKGMALFLEKAGAGTPAAQLKGNLFEYIEAARFNEKAALQGHKVRARVTAADGRPHDNADIELYKGSKVVKKVQAKVSDSPESIAKRQTDSKYKGMDRLVPKDKEDQTKAYSIQEAERRAAKGDPEAENWDESARKIKGQLKYGKVESGGTTTKELDFDNEYEKTIFAFREELRGIGREAGVAGLQAAQAGAVVGGAISFIRNSYAYIKGDIDGEKAVENITEDTVKSGVRGGSSGALGAVIRHGAHKADLPTLAKSNVATAVAASLIEIGSTVYGYAKGEIPVEQAAERIGNTGCSTFASIYTGAAAGAIFGPPGAVIGSIAGYMVTTSVYQSCIAILRDARLAEEEADRVVALCEQAVRSLGQQQAHFEAMLEECLNERQVRFDGYFKAIDEALGAGQADDAILALSSLVASCGGELQLTSFEDFHTVMVGARRSGAPLID